MRIQANRRSTPPAILPLLWLLLASGCAEFDPAVLESVLGGGLQDPLDEATVESGLREALRVGTGRAVERTSRIDGFLADELIRITLPEELEDFSSWFWI